MSKIDLIHALPLISFTQMRNVALLVAVQQESFIILLQGVKYI